MSDECFSNGDSGNCGLNCSAYLDGKCDIADEVYGNLHKEMTAGDIEEFKELYPQHIDLVNKLKGEA